MKMSDYSVDVVWHFVVPPANTRRMKITQRADGPFRNDFEGGRGHYYASEEVLVKDRWTHVEGSAAQFFTFRSYDEAHCVVERRWLELIERSGDNHGSP